MYSLHRWIVSIIEQTISTAILHKQQIFISRQARGNRLWIHGELNQHTSKQDALKQRSCLPASMSILVDCLVIGRQISQYRQPKHSLWLNKRYIWNSKTEIVKRSPQQRYRGLHQRNTSLSNVVQLTHPCWTDRITCVRKLDNIAWSDASWDIWNSPPLYKLILPWGRSYFIIILPGRSTYPNWAQFLAPSGHVITHFTWHHGKFG